MHFLRGTSTMKFQRWSKQHAVLQLEHHRQIIVSRYLWVLDDDTYGGLNWFDPRDNNLKNEDPNRSQIHKVYLFVLKIQNPISKPTKLFLIINCILCPPFDYIKPSSMKSQVNKI